MRCRVIGRLAAVLFAAIAAFPLLAFAGDVSPAESVALPVHVPELGSNADGKAPNLALRNTLIIATGVSAVVAYGERNWWVDGFDGRFETVNERWFQADTQWGGADKLGHVYGNYAGVRLLTSLFKAAGNAPRDSLSLAMWSTLGTYSAIEIADGYSRNFRFSPQDFVSNFIGAFFAYANEKNPRLDEMIDFRFGYRRTQYADHWDPVSDYSGQRYYLVLKADAFDSLRANPMTRYLELAAGYGVRNYASWGRGYNERERDIYVGVSLNLSRLMADAFYGGSKDSSTTQKVADEAFELIQFPTAVYAKHGL
jgi:hypothetical protein